MYRKYNDLIPHVEGVHHQYSFIKKNDDEKTLYSVLGKLIDQCDKSSCYVPIVDIREQLNKIEDVCEDIIKHGDSKDSDTEQFLKSVLSILKSHSNLEITIFDKSIKDFCNEVEKKVKDLGAKTSVVNSYVNLKDAISDAKKVLKSFEKIKSEFDGMEVPAELVLDDLDDLESESEKAYQDMKNYISEVAELNIDESNCQEIFGEIILDPSFSKYEDFSLDDIDKELNDLNRKKRDLYDQIYGSNGLNESIIYLKQKLKENESLPVNPLKEYSDVISDLESKLNSMSRLLNIRNGTIHKIIESEIVNDIDDNTKQYLEQVWYYLGSVISYIPYLGGIREVSKVNMLSREITTVDDLVIPLDFLSTGQSQNTYLRSILKDNDNKIYIVLFDEVSNMDYELTHSLIDMCVNLHKEGKLLVGLFTRPSQSMNSEPKVIQYL